MKARARCKRLASLRLMRLYQASCRYPPADEMSGGEKAREAVGEKEKQEEHSNKPAVSTGVCAMVIFRCVL